MKMGKFHICIIFLLFKLDVLFAQDGTVTSSQVLRITGKDEQEEKKNGYLKCEVTQPVTGTNYNLNWRNPNGQLVPLQGAPNAGRLFAVRESSFSLSLNFMPVNEDDAGQYTCEGTINGQQTSETFKIKTYRGIAFSNCPLQQNIISGSNRATISCSASAGGIDLTTYWMKNVPYEKIVAGGNKYAITADGLLIFNITKADEMYYEFNAKYDKTFAWESRNISVKVLVKPEIVNPPTFTTAKAGGTFSMLCHANGDPRPVYDWQKGDLTSNQWSQVRNSDRITIDEVNGELKILPLRKDDEGRYKCTASNEAGTAEAEATLNVQVPPDIYEIRNGSGVESGRAVISCKARGDPAPEMKWKQTSSESFYPITSEPDIKVVLNKDSANHLSTLELNFESLKPAHMGDYTCVAHNDAGDDMGFGHQEVRYAPKFNQTRRGPFYNWVGNQNGNVTCVVNGNPPPVVEWYKGGISVDAIFNPQRIEDKYQVTSILFAKLSLANEAQILGDYICRGVNAVGNSNITLRMAQAARPPAPGVSVDFFTARMIRLAINTPTVQGPAVIKYNVKYKIQGTNNNPMNVEAPVEWRGYTDDQPLPRTYVNLENLDAKTLYSISVTAINDVGESDPFEFTQTTMPYSVPQPVVITSNYRDSTSPTSYLLMWDKPDDGGSLLQKYTIRYREVEIYPNRTEYTLSKPIGGFITVDDIPPTAVRYNLQNLIPGTYYQVEIQATNNQGQSAPQSFIFKTKEDPNYRPVAGGSPLFTTSTIVTITMTALIACLQVFM